MKLALALAALTAPASFAAGQASAGTGSTVLHLLDLTQKATPAFDAGTGDPRAGDRLFLTDGLYAWKGAKRGARVGRVESTLTFMSRFGTRGATVEISGQMFLGSGSLFVQGIGRVTEGPSHFTLPIGGGTGRYAGARGVIDIRDIGRSGDKSSVDIHLLAP